MNKKIPLLGLACLLALSCGTGVPVEAPGNLPALGTSTPGTPYTDLMDGRVAEADASINPDDAAVVENDSGVIGDTGAPTDDAGIPGVDGGTSPDAGLKICPADPFKSARTAGDLPLLGDVSGEIAGDCDTVIHPLVLAKGQRVHVDVWGKSLMADLRIYGPGTRGYLMQSVKYSYGTIAAIEFTADMAGEYYIFIAQNGRRGASPYTASVMCKDGCSLKATRYPVLLVHGCSGFANIGPIEYFWQVKDTFTPQGYDIYVPVLDALNTSDKRGKELADYIDQILGQTYAKKVNIIAHSQGGLDARYAISGLSYGDRIGVLNMVATPHHGSELGDVITTDPTGVGKVVIDALGGLLGVVLDGPGRDQQAFDALSMLSREYMEKEFNPQYPDDPRVKYKSWAGKSCWAWEDCGNPIDPIMAATYGVLRNLAGDNDGIVPTASAVWGDFKGVIIGSHMNEVGHLFGATGPFDYIKFYSDMMAATKAEGY
jgi:triacylglycerol lipase